MRSGTWAVVLVTLGFLMAGPIRAGSPVPPGRAGGIAWQAWSPSVFEEAGRSGRRILVDLTASWCHACNIMEEETFRDSAVARAVERGFVPVRVDIDAFPDLHLRFHLRFRGLPTILILDPDGQVLRQANGMNALDFMDFLEPGIRDDPGSQEVSSPPRVAEGAFSGAVARELLAEDDVGGTPWGGGVFLESSTLLFLAEMSASPDSLAPACRATVLRWLDRLLGPPLLDTDGGGYFRTVPQWGRTEPHREKLLTVQSEVIETFLAGAKIADPERGSRYRAAARSAAAFALRDLRGPASSFFAVARNVDVFRPEDGTIAEPGSGYDPDSAAPEVLLPRLEPGVYLDGNARFASALMHLGLDGDPEAGLEGLRLLDALWDSTRSAPGGFRHSPGRGESGPATLHDLASLGIALIDAGSVSSRADYMEHAVEVARAMEARRPPGGAAFALDFGSSPAPLVVDGNDRAAFFLARLGRETGEEYWLSRARRVFREVVDQGVLVEEDAAALGRCALTLGR